MVCNTGLLETDCHFVLNCDGTTAERQVMLRKLEGIWGREQNDLWRSMVPDERMMALLNEGGRDVQVGMALQEFLVIAWEGRKIARQENVLRPGEG